MHYIEEMSHAWEGRGREKENYHYSLMNYDVDVSRDREPGAGGRQPGEVCGPGAEDGRQVYCCLHFADTVVLVGLGSNCFRRVRSMFDSRSDPVPGPVSSSVNPDNLHPDP